MASSNKRLKEKAFMVTAPRTMPPGFDQLEQEHVRCVIDLRGTGRPGEEAAYAVSRLGAESREMYYAHLPHLAVEATQDEPSRLQAWAARTALRHRTCFLTTGTEDEREAASAIVGLVGLRLIELTNRPLPEQQAD